MPVPTVLYPFKVFGESDKVNESYSLISLCLQDASDKQQNRN